MKSIWERQSINVQCLLKLATFIFQISEPSMNITCPLKEHLLLQNALQATTKNILLFAESQQLLQL